MANWTFNSKEYTARNFEVVPEGDYKVNINKVVEKIFNRRWTSCRKEKAEHSMPRFGIPAPADFPVMPSRKLKMPQIGVVRSMIMNTRFFLCDGSAHTVISFVPLKMSRFLNFEPCGATRKITCLIWIDWGMNTACEIRKAAL